MKEIIAMLEKMNEDQLANTFDIVAALPISKEGNAVLEKIMGILESRNTLKFAQWLKQTRGAALSNYYN